MAPRLKILMASGSKKEPRYTFSFLSKIPANEPPLGSLTGPLWREMPVYRALCIPLDNVTKIPLIRISAALGIQHALRMRRIILPSVTCPAVPYCSTLSHKRHDYRKKVTQHEMCFLIFSKNFISNISHSQKHSARYDHNVHTYRSVSVFSTTYSCHVVIKF
jgi:hypothetical protein